MIGATGLEAVAGRVEDVGNELRGQGTVGLVDDGEELALETAEGGDGLVLPDGKVDDVSSRAGLSVQRAPMESDCQNSSSAECTSRRLVIMAEAIWNYGDMSRGTEAARWMSSERMAPSGPG